VCKILILQSHDAARRDALVSSAWRYFHASGEVDGFGALWVSQRGELSWLKSSIPDIAAANSLPPWADSFFQRGGGAADASDGGWLMLHGRRATCGIDVDNTHPMLTEAGDHGLIHNGVVTSDSVANISTTCDSELLLRAWIQAGDKGLSHIAGYFAFAGLFKARRGWDAVIVRDDQARLRVGQLPGGAWAWGTTDEALKCGGAVPLCDFRRNTGLVYSTGKPKPRQFSVTKAITVKRSNHLENAWAVASGRDSGKTAWSQNGRVFTGRQLSLNGNVE
jgi:hypothetical protein